MSIFTKSEYFRTDWKQGEDYNDYPYAYLLTATRFLGYSSNLVLVWNLYSTSKKLKAMILEVKKAIDERHVRSHFLKAQEPPNDTSVEKEKELEEGLQNHGASLRAGKKISTSLYLTLVKLLLPRRLQPILTSIINTGPVNTLNSSKAHAKLIARVFYTSARDRPLPTMLAWQKTTSILIQWWVGLATFPKTVHQTLFIMFNRGLHWVFRPKPWERYDAPACE
jgi:hypothetical protein